MERKVLMEEKIGQRHHPDNQVGSSENDNAQSFGARPSDCSKRILVVEDNLVNYKIVSRFLNKWGFEHANAENGVEALQMMETECYALALMDLHMPLMDGYETTRQIRAHEDSRKANLPIIAFSADAVAEIQQKASEAGINGFANKPFKPAELHAEIERLIASR